jgi:hypothetical protein
MYQKHPNEEKNPPKNVQKGWTGREVKVVVGKKGIQLSMTSQSRDQG